MQAITLEEDIEEKMSTLLKNAYYAGKRAILRGKKGGKAALVPPEDLDFLEKVEGFVHGACYAGERVILQGKEGSQVAMVSLEDLQILEDLERKELYES